jgi:hypothetical protein
MDRARPAGTFLWTIVHTHASWLVRAGHERAPTCARGRAASLDLEMSGFAEQTAPSGESREALRKPTPGRLWPWVKRASWVELAIFAGLCFFWLAPGFDQQAMVFGWAHGIGFIALCLLIWIAILRHEAPYTLLAATLTPVGPVGSVVGISVIERKRNDAG